MSDQDAFRNIYLLYMCMSLTEFSFAGKALPEKCCKKTLSNEHIELPYKKVEVVKYIAV